MMTMGEVSLLDCAESCSRRLRTRCRVEDTMAGAIRGLAACVTQRDLFSSKIRDMADAKLEVLRKEGVDTSKVDASSYAEALNHFGGATNARALIRMKDAYEENVEFWKLRKSAGLWTALLQDAFSLHEAGLQLRSIVSGSPTLDAEMKEIEKRLTELSNHISHYGLGGRKSGNLSAFQFKLLGHLVAFLFQASLQFLE